MSTDIPSNSYRNKSFCGKDFTGQDLSYADITGTDFSGATLVNVDLSHSKAGIKLTWRLIHRFLLIILTASSTFSAAYAGSWIGGLTDRIDSLVGAVVIVALTLGIFCGFGAIAILRGIGAELWIFSVLIVTAVVIILAIPSPGNNRVFMLLVVLLLAVMIASCLVGAVAVSIAQLLFRRWLSADLIFVALLSAGLAAYTGTLELVGKPSRVWALVLMVPFSLILLALFIYIGSRATKGDAKYRLIHRISMAISSKGATSFRNADLSGANFSDATLKNVDMRGSILTRTNFHQSRYLDQARLEGTYLSNSRVRELVTSKNGDRMSLRGVNLRGLNLSQASLVSADLMGASLIGADLRSANLAKANLSQSQLYGADFTGACLTGATIENWAISTDSVFDDVDCDYVYMRSRSEDDLDPWRKPDNRNDIFQPGDFKDFIAPIFKTLSLYRQQFVDPRQIEVTIKSLDLYHHGGVDPAAATIALKQLAEAHPAAGLKIIALEGQGNEKIRLQTQVSGESDRSKLSAEYAEKYRAAAALPYSDLQSVLSVLIEKDRHMKRLEQMVATAMGSDRFYVEANYDLGPHMPGQSVKKILILTANPERENQNRLDEQVREIQAGLERAKKRDQFEIISKWAVRAEDLRRALLDHAPHIVQFSGVGIESKGLALESDIGETNLVPAATLASLFEVFKDDVECVFLNACYSAEQTQAISQHIPYVIGMKQALGDRAALEFAIGFYDALGAGRSIEEAFKIGCISLDLQGLPTSLTPILQKKDG